MKTHFYRTKYALDKLQEYDIKEAYDVWWGTWKLALLAKDLWIDITVIDKWTCIGEKDSFEPDMAKLEEHGISYLRSNLEELVDTWLDKKDWVVCLYTLHLLSEPIENSFSNFEKIINKNWYLICVFFEEVEFEGKVFKYQSKQEIKEVIKDKREILDWESYNLDKDKVHACVMKKLV